MRTDAELSNEVLAVGASVLAHERASAARDRAGSFGDAALLRALNDVAAYTRLAARYGARGAEMGALRLGAGAKDLDPELERAKAIVRGELGRELQGHG